MANKCWGKNFKGIFGGIKGVSGDEMKGKRRPLGISSQIERLYDGNQQRGVYKRIKYTWRLQGDCIFSGNAFLEDSIAI